jgi:hypothetical protein
MERAGKLPRRESGAGIARDGVVAKKETRGSYGVRRFATMPGKRASGEPRGTHPLQLQSPTFAYKLHPILI